MLFNFVITHKLVRLIKNILQPGSNISKTSYDLVILDDLFPHLISPFRITEFNELLENFTNSVVFTSVNKFRVQRKKVKFNAVKKTYFQIYPQNRGRIFLYDLDERVTSKLCYVVFLNNAANFFPYITACGLPFVLELYPGGGFQLNDNNSDKKLELITSSPLLKKIIVTQKVTQDYLIDNGFCTPDKVELIYGGVFPANQLNKCDNVKRYFLRDKKTFDICFVAHKYTKHGKDKGYDVFINVAHILSKLIPEAVFHIVGPFDHNDIDVSAIHDRIIFYGPRTTDFFPSFYSGMEIILSPNAPNILSPGAFDGFPTGACIEAALCGTVIFACDLLKLNPFYDGEEIVIIPRDPEKISLMIHKYAKEPELLYKISQRSKERFQQVFSIENQMAPRLRILEQSLTNGGTYET